MNEHDLSTVFQLEVIIGNIDNSPQNIYLTI